MIQRLLPVLFAVALAAPTHAAVMQYSGTIAPENGSGVTGTVLLTLTDLTSLTVQISAAGLEPNEVHPAHLHGKIGPGGTLLPPTAPVDLDGDGYIETPEGELAVGPPIIPLGEFTVGPSGTLNTTTTVDLTNPLSFENGGSAATLDPFTFLTFEIHGRTVPAGAGAGTPYEVDGTGGYKILLPVGGAPITAAEVGTVPEPSTYGMIMVAAAFMAARIARRKS